VIEFLTAALERAMKSRLMCVVILLAGSAAAQLDQSPLNRIDITVINPNVDQRLNSPTNQKNYATGALVSAADLAIPARARKKFDKANGLLRKQDWRHAAKDLEKAVSIDPGFAGAYNNLGVAYANLGDIASERDALQKAIELNDHFALAFVNLGRMDITNGNYPAAQAAFENASTLDATDPIALTLLAYAELQQGHLSQTVGASQKAHALSEPHALAHRFAARAFEQQGQFESAIAELTEFLKEEASGPRADSAREEIEVVRRLQH
jgi:tetratricopeptide (TPR) repeat protein